MRAPLPAAPLARILVLIESDTFALSHFKPVLAVLRELAPDVVVAARNTGAFYELEQLGHRVIPFEISPQPRRPSQHAAVAWSLSRILETERPDLLHVIGMKPAVLAALALKFSDVPRVVVHMTGAGALRIGRDRRNRFYRTVALRLLGGVLRKPSGHLLVENLDDLDFLRNAGADPGGRFAVLQGAGVDPQVLPALPQSTHGTPVAAFVGRMLTTKGVDLFMQAIEILHARDMPLQPLMCGPCPAEARDAADPEFLRAWCARHGGVWREHVPIREVWLNADMFVLPSRGGEGMPRAMLEAAASQRPLIVSNVPGCRDFVRHGVEGLLVTPDDPEALAAAIGRLAADAELRQTMGEAARLRLLHGFTEAHVTQTLRAFFAAMFTARR